MSEPVIRVEGLGKQYRLGQRGARYETLRDSLAGLFKSRKNLASAAEKYIWALKDVSFEVKQGEVIGIIGRNGAGKSTLLKVLSRITEPTEGQAEIHGWVGSLLEVGTGFHSELTGRENVFLNGAILGMGRREIAQKMDQIIAFAELERFMDTPVKFYSSGMYLRLGFSVAAHLETEILLIDEVLAVGDVAFQKKCIGKIGDAAKSGRTIFFVSHNMAAVRNLCERTLLIDNGRLMLDTDTDTAVSAYLEQHLTQEGALAPFEVCEENVEGKARKVKETLRFREVGLYNQKGDLCSNFFSDENIRIKIAYECLTTVSDLWLTLQVVDEDNRPLLTTNNTDDKESMRFYRREPGVYHSTCTIPPDFFGEKQFFITIHMFSSTADERLVLNKILKFDVTFKGYNNLHDDHSKNSFLRPLLKWDTRI